MALANLWLGARKNTRPAYLIGLFITAILGFIFSLQFAAVCLSLVASYQLTSSLLRNRFFNSKFMVLVTAIFLYFILLQSVITASWTISKNVPLDWAPFTTLCFLIVNIIYAKILAKQSRPRIKSIPWFNFADVIATCVAIIMLGFLVGAPFFRYGVQDKSSVVAVVLGGADDAAHLGMFNDHLHFNKGTFQGAKTAEPLRQRDGGTYPTSWHAANASVVKSIDPKITTGSESLYAYAFTKIFWYALLVFIFTRALFITYETFTKKSTPLYVAVWLGIASLMISYFFLVDPFLEGFYNYVPQLIAVVLMGVALIQFASYSKSDAHTERQTILLLALLGIGGALSWLLVLPAIVLAIAISFLDQIRGSLPWRLFVKRLFNGIVRYLPIYLLLAVGMLAQVFMSSFAEPRIGFISTILATGGIALFSSAFYVFLLLGASLCVGLVEKKSQRYIKAFLNLAGSLLLFSGFIYLLQMHYADTNTYYYFKTLNIFLILVAQLAIIGFALLLDWINRNKALSTAVLVTGLLPLIVLQLIGLDSTKYPIGLSSLAYIKGIRNTSSEVNRSIFSELQGNANQSNYGNADYVIFYEPGKVVQNYFGTMVLKSNKPFSECFQSLLAPVISADNFENVMQTIEEMCPKSYTITIVTAKSDLNALRAIVAKSNVSAQLKVESYETTYTN